MPLSLLRTLLELVICVLFVLAGLCAYVALCACRLSAYITRLQEAGHIAGPSQEPASAPNRTDDRFSYIGTDGLVHADLTPYPGVTPNSRNNHGGN